MDVNVYRWEAKRPSQQVVVAGQESPATIIYPAYASVEGVVAANALATMGAQSRQRRAIRREVRSTLRAVPRWKGGAGSTAVVGGGWIQGQSAGAAWQRPITEVRFWAIHPKAGKGIVASFSEHEGLMRYEPVNPAEHASLEAEFRQWAPTQQGTWTPEPIDHPLPRYMLDAVLTPVGGMLGSLSALLSAIFLILLPPLWIPAVGFAVASLVGAQRDPDTFRPGLRTWFLFSVPILGVIAWIILTGL